MTRGTIHARLEAAVESNSAQPAVIDGERSSAYVDLDESANRVAHALVDRGVGPGSRVGLYLDKSIEAVAAIYGVLKAGAAYVPLDPRAPTSRLGYIARNCELRCLISGRSKATRWLGLLHAGAGFDHLIVIDGGGELSAHVPDGASLCDAAELSEYPRSRPAGAGTNAADLAYILYTSGSTGEPKGVMLSHDNALAFVDWAVQAVGVHEDDRLSSHAPFHFDLSVFDLFAAATAGAPVVLVPHKALVFPAELANFITNMGITVWYSVPSALNMLGERGGVTSGDLATLRAVIFAGEVFPSRHLSRLMRLVPDAAFWNFYGPTETNVCTAYEVPEPPDPDGPDIPIGTPIDGVRAFVVGDNGAEVGRGEVGELLIAGPTVMQGYWADDVRTTTRLVVDPADGTQMVYRTGDLVAQEADGNFRFLGRRDNQIKSRGYRIELGEIETVLNGYVGVVECAVVAIPDDLVTNRIHAHVVVSSGTSTAELAALCSERLPAYMVPEHFEVVERLPRTSTGKIDRHALATP